MPEGLNRPIVERLPDGTVITAEVVDPLEIDEHIGDTEEHEAKHAVVALVNGTNVEHASIIPEGNSLGHVLLSSPDAVSAVAPHADGHGGTSHDLMIIRMMGLSPDQVKGRALDILRKYKKHIRAVASELKRKKRLSGQQIQDTMRRVDKQEVILITITLPNGEKKVKRWVGTTETVVPPTEIRHKIQQTISGPTGP